MSLEKVTEIKDQIKALYQFRATDDWKNMKVTMDFLWTQLEKNLYDVNRDIIEKALIECSINYLNQEELVKTLDALPGDAAFPAFAEALGLQERLYDLRAILSRVLEKMPVTVQISVPVSQPEKPVSVSIRNEASSEEMWKAIPSYSLSENSFSHPKLKKQQQVLGKQTGF